MARPEADAELARAKDLCSTLCKIDGAAANGQFEAKRGEATAHLSTTRGENARGRRRAHLSVVPREGSARI